MLDWFELTSVAEESIGESPDRVFKVVLHIYLDERDNRTDETSYLRPNGFTEETTIKDFPARDRKVVLHVRRRCWFDENNSNCIMNVYNLAVSGTRYSEGFAEFLKKNLDTTPVTTRLLGCYYMTDGDALEKAYKNILSDYKTWDQKDHSSERILLHDNIGKRLSIDETFRGISS